jgi:hypothetical protein
MRSLYESVMLETALGDRLTQLGIDLGIARPPILFSDDGRWRAAVRALAYSKKHTRNALVNFMSLLVGPKKSQVTVLNRTNYAKIFKGDSLTIDAPSPNAGTYTVNEVLSHHLIFPAGTFTAPDLNVTYLVKNTGSSFGNIIDLADGRQALIDTSVLFVNTHPKDFLSKLNIDIPQNGTLIFDKNADPSLTNIKETTYNYDFYDRYSSGILKLDEVAAEPNLTRNSYSQMRASVLNASVQTGATTIEIADSTNFPLSPALVDQIQVGDEVTVLNVPTVGPLPITAITGKHELVIGGGGLPVPASPTTTELAYIITNPASVPANTALSGNRGHFFSSKGKIYSATKLVDFTHDFTADVKPYIEGTKEPFSVTINRGENNEETVEVLSLAGNTLQLVLDPKDKLGQTSLLKYNHAKGEPVEVYYEVKYSTGTYFPLTGAGATVGTADAASTTTVLVDAGATFVPANADGSAAASYGDEVELVTVPVGSLNVVGERRTVITYGAGPPNQLTVFPAFKGPLAGCTYRIRKLYKAVADPTAPPANADQFLYLADTSVFPAENFSVIIDRGNPQEEVLWITANDLTLNRLTIGNSDHGTATTAYPYFFKNHNFGAVVEPAQILVESCTWDVIETRATGEYTIALDEACIKDDSEEGWYLHEKTPHHLVDASSGVIGAGAQVGEVRGEDVVGGALTAITYIPKAPLAVFITAGDTSFQLSEENFVRLIANEPDSNNTKSGNFVFRPVFIDDGNAKEEKFVTTLSKSSFGTLAVGVNAGDTSFITDLPLTLGGQAKIGRWNSSYPNQTETIGGPFASVAQIATGVHAGKYLITFAAGFSFSHSAGESITTYPNVTLEVSASFANGFAVASSTFVHYLYTHPSYRHKSALVKDAAMDTSAITYGASTTLVHKNNPVVAQFSRAMVDSELYIKSDPGGTVNPVGQRRKISAVGGHDNGLLMVDETVAFGTAVAGGSEFDIRSFLQSWDLSDNRVDIMGNANSAFPAALNLVNLNTYAGGHKSTFPGRYVYQQINEFGEPVDQPTRHTVKLLTTHDPADPSAAYKFPGPRRLIVPPLLPYSKEVVAAAHESYVLSPQALAAGLTAAQVVGKSLQVIGPISSRDYRKVKEITHYNPATGAITCINEPFLDSLFSGQPALSFRILGDPTTAAIDPADSPGFSFWIDYPEFFPDPAQGDCTIVLGRGTAKTATVNVTNVINEVGVDYGKCLTVATQTIADSFYAGESVELEITKVALPTILDPTIPQVDGGFYLGFGFKPGVYRWEEIGLGGSPSAGQPLGNFIDKEVSGVHSAATYVGTGEVEHKMYAVPASSETLNLPSSTTQSVRARCRVLSAVASGATTQIRVTGFNFRKQKNRWFIGGRVMSNRMLATAGGETGSVITDIDPTTSTITVSPALAAPLPATGDPIVILGKSIPVDDRERQSDINDFLSMSGVGTTGMFPTLTAQAASTTTNIRVAAALSPLSTAAIGKRLQATSGGISGEVRTIVNLGSSTPSPANYDEFVVSPAFSGPTVGVVFNVIPAEDLFVHNHHQAVGGVYTGINFPDPVTPTGDCFPAHSKLLVTGGVWERGGSREGGIVQEYVEYSSKDVNIYTLKEPFYPKHDHAPGSTVIIGSNIFTTQGYGKDYRPYLAGNFLGLLFASILASFNSLFRAAGVESKSEVTELGN